ncbi:N-glycosylation protein-domain-containing protein [Mycena pura]|uniref:N-glycosylation protein-domain-containing protein n=1 Tax=Mycena pura TaxID=153505 RepID=A0AAD6VF12_9AGAR|nr:N-glycosylation protein-domain-containing protein [Mycena pura]
MPPDSDDNTDEDDVIYTRAARRASSLRTRLFGARGKTATISTTPGRRGAGETETELDEPPRHLPTTRIIRASAPLVPPTTLEQRLTPLLFEFSRLLAIVPAFFGTLYNIYSIYDPPSGAHTPERIDFFVSALWAILTGYQCLALTTGLLTRWRVYYPPLATLIRLLALQAICWPATHLTLSLLDHARRPAAVWAVIGTTTCASRSVQIWVTSNLWWETQTRDAAGPGSGPGAGAVSANGGGASGGAGAGTGTRGWRRIGGRWGGRRWDWRDVGFQCMLPAGLLYFVMAWAEQLRREWSTC